MEAQGGSAGVTLLAWAAEAVEDEGDGARVVVQVMVGWGLGAAGVKDLAVKVGRGWVVAGVKELAVKVGLGWGVATRTVLGLVLEMH